MIFNKFNTNLNFWYLNTISINVILQNLMEEEYDHLKDLVKKFS